MEKRKKRPAQKRTTLPADEETREIPVLPWEILIRICTFVPDVETLKKLLSVYFMFGHMDNAQRHSLQNRLAVFVTQTFAGYTADFWRIGKKTKHGAYTRWAILDEGPKLVSREMYKLGRVHGESLFYSTYKQPGFAARFVSVIDWSRTERGTITEKLAR